MTDSTNSIILPTKSPTRMSISNVNFISSGGSNTTALLPPQASYWQSRGEAQARPPAGSHSSFNSTVSKTPKIQSQNQTPASPVAITKALNPKAKPFIPANAIPNSFPWPRSNVDTVECCTMDKPFNDPRRIAECDPISHAVVMNHVRKSRVGLA